LFEALPEKCLKTNSENLVFPKVFVCDVFVWFWMKVNHRFLSNFVIFALSWPVGIRPIALVITYTEWLRDVVDCSIFIIRVLQLDFLCWFLFMRFFRCFHFVFLYIFSMDLFLYVCVWTVLCTYFVTVAVCLFCRNLASFLHHCQMFIQIYHVHIFPPLTYYSSMVGSKLTML